MKPRTAAQIVRLLSVEDREGFHAPGAGRFLHQKSESGRSVLVVSRGDEFDLVVGRPPDSMIVHPIPARQLLALAWFVIWRWWFLGTWCGLKTWLWERAVAVLFSEHGDAEEARQSLARDPSRTEARRPASR